MAAMRRIEAPAKESEPFRIVLPRLYQTRIEIPIEKMFALTEPVVPLKS